MRKSTPLACVTTVICGLRGRCRQVVAHVAQALEALGGGVVDVGDRAVLREGRRGGSRPASRRPVRGKVRQRVRARVPVRVRAKGRKLGVGARAGEGRGGEVGRLSCRACRARAKCRGRAGVARHAHQGRGVQRARGHAPARARLQPGFHHLPLPHRLVGRRGRPPRPPAPQPATRVGLAGFEGLAAQAHVGDARAHLRPRVAARSSGRPRAPCRRPAGSTGRG
jgi:hypothetical protein